jgi:secreted trypsin-like serine protease
MKLNLNSFAFLIILGTLAACSGSNGGSNDTEPSNNACSVLGLNLRIINGTQCESKPSAVVKLRIDGAQGSSLCTGTMITNNKVLTASHCVTLGTFTDVVSANNISISTGNVFAPIARGKRIFNSNSAVSDLRKISEVSESRGQGELVDNDPVAFYNYVEEFGLADIAVVELDRNLNLPTISLKTSSVPTPGSLVSIFGFGVTDGNSTDTSANLISGQMITDRNGPKNIFASFNGKGSNTCGGDSGGPLIEQFSNGQIAVVGTVLGGTVESCSSGDTSSFTAVGGEGVEDFLRSVAPEANYK